MAKQLIVTSLEFYENVYIFTPADPTQWKIGENTTRHTKVIPQAMIQNHKEMMVHLWMYKRKEVLNTPKN